MPYVSARYAPIDPEALKLAPGPPSPAIIATDDQGVDWALNEDSQVGDWLRYIEGGGTIEGELPQPDAKPAEEEEEDGP